MYVLTGADVNVIYPRAGRLLREVGVHEPSRYGDVIVAPRPVTSHYENPRNRVLFDPIRDANPFFHLMESLWILAGRNDVEWLAQFNNRMREFSDDGRTFHAPYGRRLRHWPVVKGMGPHVDEIDQIDVAVRMLIDNPGNRRVVLEIWDPARDLGTVSKDIPCNDQIKLEIRDGRLNLVVFCRSNDIIWGCYGANVVQFSMLQEYLAGRIGVEVGWMEQVSTNWHAYLEVWEEKAPWASPLYDAPYETGEVKPFPLMGYPGAFDHDLDQFMWWTAPGASPGDFPKDSRFVNNFFTHVAVPMFLAWKNWKKKEWSWAKACLGRVAAPDWRLAGTQWMERRAPQ